jgi:RNA polymerase sigma-B factor
MSVHRDDERATEVREQRDRSTRNLLRKAALVADPTTAQDLFEEAVLLNEPMASALARQYHQRGVDPEDLVQVAMLGLVKAVRGYQPGSANSFAAYAVPTIRGELKRHFRDRGWMIRPPRRLQELNRAVSVVETELAQRLQRMPTTDEVAEHLGVDTCAVDEARTAGGGYHAASVDSPFGETGQLLRDVAADPDDPFETVDTFLTLRPALDTLGCRERRLLQLRFVDNLTQEQIGSRIGVSQMHVSRLLTAILAKLRRSIEGQQAA